MYRKIFILISLSVILVVLSAFTIQELKQFKTAKADYEQVTKASTKKVVKSKNRPRTTEATTTETSQAKISDERSIFEEEQVLTEAVYAKKTLEGSEVGKDILPIGTVVSVEKVEGNEDWVQIKSDPKKGFIEKKILKPRQSYIDEREDKRQAKLSKQEFKQVVDQKLNHFVKEKGGNISIYVESTDDKFSYSFYGDEVKRTASSIKLPFIAYLMTLVDQNKVDLNRQLTYTANYKMDGTGIIQFEPIGTQYSIGKLAELVIRYSDNVAYIMLLNYLGESNFIQYLKELDPNSPNNRAHSTSIILTKAMEYVNENKDKSTNIMTLYKWLQTSIFDDGVAVGLPGVDVNHKTGWMPMYAVSNDIALVKDKKNPYYITIMTTGYDQSYSELVIGDLAKIIDDNMLELAV
ncbi:serine hydrolase [Vagococcus silagei]|uniref:Serine hydrolase n=1 Tax=Vagococcus silagei TaxID=2508885 RepID=A0A4S3AZL8_9ENTE|nr:serine hydrolase [Vagococcus silagei]THB60191.1 serine hydrolase [Vagococcus silagei]